MFFVATPIAAAISDLVTCGFSWIREIICCCLSVKFVATFFSDIAVQCLSLYGGFEWKGDGGDGAVAFDGWACACQGFPACKFVHAVSGVLCDADNAE